MMRALHRGEPAVGVAADRVVHRQRMALGVQADRLLAAERQLDRRTGHLRQQRGLGLHRHVLLAAERAAVRHQLDVDALRGDAEEARHLPAIVEDALALRVQAQRAVGHRLGQRALGLEEQMLDALRGPGAADHMRAGGERGVGVAAPHDRALEQVLVLRVDARRVGFERAPRVEHRRQHLVADVDQRGRLARGVAVDRGDGRQHVADAAHLFALGDEARPVVEQQSDPALAWHVGGGGDGAHAGQRAGARGVDAQHAGARMRRQHQRAVQHAGPGQIADEGPVAQRGLRGADARQRLADAAVGAGRRDRLAALGRGEQLDRVDDLHVAGAAAQVPVERVGDRLARRRGVAVGDRLGAQRDAGDAEAALQPGRGGEAVGDLLAFGGRQAVERDDVLAVGDPGAHRAGRLRMAVDQHHAGAALALRAAAVLRRGDAAALAQRLQEPLVVPRLDALRASVQVELDQHGGVGDCRARCRCRRSAVGPTSGPGSVKASRPPALRLNKGAAGR